MNIKVKAIQQYGRWVYYPLCRQAKLFAKIADSKTLTPGVMLNIRALGYEIETELDKPAVHEMLDQ